MIRLDSDQATSFSPGLELFFSFEESAYPFIYSIVGVDFLSEIEETIVEFVYPHLL